MQSNWLISFFVLVASTSCFSQNYFHSPNDTLIANTILDGQVTMNITQIHPNNDTLHFSWNKLDVVMPFGWEANICDNSFCYPSLENSGTTLPVLPGDNGLMLIHCTPHITEGSAIIRYTISEANTPWQIDTLTWIINATVAGITSNHAISPKIWTYKNDLYFDEISTDYNSLIIYNSLGEAVFDTKFSTENIFHLPLLTPSIYFVQLVGDSNILTQKIILTE